MTLENHAGHSAPEEPGRFSGDNEVHSITDAAGAQSEDAKYTQDTTTPIKYSVGGTAYVPQSGSTLDCSPSEVIGSTKDGGGALTLTAGTPTTAATMGFTGCQLFP